MSANTETCTLSFPRDLDDVFKSIVLSDQCSKSPNNQLTIIYDKEKQHITSYIWKGGRIYPIFVWKMNETIIWLAK